MILVTGVSGFIGQHLLRALIKEYGDEKIIAFTSKPISECPFLLHNDYSFDKDYFVKSGFSEIRTIIHAGAFTPKNGAQANDWNACNSNIFNTAKLLGAEYPNLERIVYLSTLDVYGEDKVISEDSPLIPVSLYGDSKLYCERLISAVARERNIICQILRVGHVYGPGEDAYEKIIPITIRKIINKEPLQIWGTGKDIRSFININDIVKAIITSLLLEQNSGPINLVSNQQITIKELVENLIAISGTVIPIEYVSIKSNKRDLVFDNKKMRTLLLQDEISLNQGLTEEWLYMKQKNQ